MLYGVFLIVLYGLAMLLSLEIELTPEPVLYAARYRARTHCCRPVGSRGLPRTAHHYKNGLVG